MQMDGALSYIQNAGNDASPVNEKLVVRKIDWRIIPIMFACYTMQFLDKVLINVSPLFQQAFNQDIVLTAHSMLLSWASPRISSL